MTESINKVNEQKQEPKKLTLIAAIIIGLGNIVGIGIFFKNGSIFSFNNNNAFGSLMS
jgi:hypothetical protein